MKQTLNRVAVLVLLVAGAVLAGAIHLLHRYQVKRNAHALLVQADQSEQEGQPAHAAGYLVQYLGLVPGDEAVLARHALLAERLAGAPKERARAFFLLEQALRRNGSRQDVRRRAARLALELDRVRDARHHLNALLDAGPQRDAELLQLEARCAAKEKQFNKAADYYTKAVEREPGNVEVCLELGSLLRGRLASPAEADAVVERMVAANKRSLAARLAAASYYRQFGAWEQAEKALPSADELKAADGEALWLAAEVAQARGQEARARRLLREGVKRTGDGRLSQRLAQLELRAGRRDEALRLVRARLRALPEDAEELRGLANLLVDLDQTSEAQKLLGRLRAPGLSWVAAYLQARLLIRQESWGEARQALESTRSSAPPSPAAARHAELLLAGCLERLGSHDQQLRAARRALDGDPTSLPARRAVASALAAVGHLDEAVREYRLLAEQAPEVSGELAGLLLVRNRGLPPSDRRWDELDRVLERAPASLETQLLRAEALVDRGRPLLAEQLIEAERKRRPEEVGPWLFLIHLARRQGRPQAVLPLVAEAERQVGRRPEWQLVRAQQWALAVPETGSQRQLAKLETEARKFPAPERDRLLHALGQAFLQIGDRATAGRLWRELAQRQPGNLEVRARLLELAFEAGNEKETDRLLSEAQRIEGSSGAVTAFAQAVRAMLRARRGEGSALAAARTHLERAAESRPSWVTVTLLRADVAEAMGKPEQAERHYRDLAQRGLEDATVLQAVASFYGRIGQRAKAEPFLRRLLAPQTMAPAATVAQARRALAVNLALGGNYRQFKEAQALLAESKRDTVADRQARALVLATRPEHRRQAILLFEELSRLGRPAAEVRFRLFELYEADGNWPKARAQLLALLGEHDKSPVYLAAYVRALLRHQQAEEAGPWLDRLEKLGRPAEVLALGARAMHANGQTAAAIRLVQSYAKGNSARLDVAGSLLEELGRPAEAEKLYRAHASRSPAGRLLLAQHLARRAQVEEALRLCEQAWLSMPAEVAAYASVEVVRAGKPGPAQRARVESWLAEQIRQQPKSLLLPVFLGELQGLGGRHAESIATYRGLVRLAPRNVVALNNLAYLLALTEREGAEALQLIEAAIDEAGPDAELLDTRGLVHLACKRAEEAVQSLEQAVATAPSAARYFHLAQAHLLARDRSAARQAYAKARELGLRARDLHPLEQNRARELARELSRE
jgi:lipopolysaccharide biosynthesis regulator YciM